MTHYRDFWYSTQFGFEMHVTADADATPLVSVLMTAYNREQYIEEAIESVLASSYTNFELIITDDCSTDNTIEIAKGYEQKDSRIRIYLNDKNLKDYPNRNKAATYAKGKYIKYLDSDDTIYPDGLEYCISAMEKYPEAGIGMLFFQKEYSGEDPVCWDSEKVIRHHFLVRGCLNIGPSGSIIRRDVFETSGGFDTRFGVASDNYFNIRLAAHHPVVFLPQEFFFYRIHDGQEIKDKRGYIQNNYLYLKELLETANLHLSKLEKEQLGKMVEKTFAKELIRFWLKSKNLRSLKEIMEITKFSFKDIMKTFIN